MPSKDPVTGRQLSGAEKARRRAARSRLTLIQGGDDPAPAVIERPPLDDVEDAVAWAGSVQAYAAQLALAEADYGRVRSIGRASRAIGKLKSAARVGQAAAVVLRERLGIAVDVHAEAPPVRPEARVTWAFWRAVDLLYRVATGSSDEEAVMAQAGALAQLADLVSRKMLAELRREVEARAAADSS